MRTLVKVSVPVERGNAAIKDGSLPRVIGQFMETARPESSYFGTEGGKRTGFFVVDFKDSTDIPPLLEPFFMQLNAEIEMSPVMNSQELQAGLAKVKL